MSKKQTERQMDKARSRNQNSWLKPTTAIIIAAIITAVATIVGVLIQNYSHRPDLEITSGLKITQHYGLDSKNKNHFLACHACPTQTTLFLYGD